MRTSIDLVGPAVGRVLSAIPATLTALIPDSHFKNPTQRRTVVWLTLLALPLGVR